ncbi:helix-turn-helix transcriptional regulator [Planctellipticum variicoloris]|uniref:helix-turn-helix transcriptional regulator n=1 Tax=Planctellipticum variicoloris TaxID=3064265 RepID=UPI0030139E6C|nr:helix-turn-helix domain-containing protein [Planctomycetaceae bacterium SH412]
MNRPAPDAFVEPLLLDARDAATLCGLSPASWYRRVSAGHTPAPVRIGGAVRWRVDDLRRWIGLGCPDRATFQTLTADPRG